MNAAVYLPVDENNVQRSQMADFIKRAQDAAGRKFGDYPQLHRWACEHYRDFWKLALDYFSLDTAGSPDPVCIGDSIETAAFFPNLKLNYAQSLLRTLPGAPDSHPAVICLNEA